MSGRRVSPPPAPPVPKETIPEDLYKAITGPVYDLEAITHAFRGFLDLLSRPHPQVGAAIRQVTKRELWHRGGRRTLVESFHQCLRPGTPSPATPAPAGGAWRRPGMRSPASAR